MSIQWQYFKIDRRHRYVTRSRENAYRESRYRSLSFLPEPGVKDGLSYRDNSRGHRLSLSNRVSTHSHPCNSGIIVAYSDQEDAARSVDHSVFEPRQSIAICEDTRSTFIDSSKIKAAIFVSPV